MVHMRRRVAAELPPHARRILAGEAQRRTNQGTTSACAENTPIRTGQRHPRENYLRMRGEYVKPALLHKQYEELPPHARRIPIVQDFLGDFFGTTSACAENTLNELGLL